MGGPIVIACDGKPVAFTETGQRAAAVHVLTDGAGARETLLRDRIHSAIRAQMAPDEGEPKWGSMAITEAETILIIRIPQSDGGDPGVESR